MRVYKFVTFLLLFFILFINNVKAECDYESKLEINTAAANIDTSLNFDYKIIDPEGVEHPEATGKTDDIERFIKVPFVNININNISDKVYLRIVNEEDNLNEVIFANDLIDGKYIYSVSDTDIIRTYTIKVYSNVNECLDEEIRTIVVKTPMYNYLSGTSVCENNNSYYCQEYVTTPIDFDPSDLLQKQNSISNNNQNEEVINLENNKKLVFYIIGGGVVILIIIILIIIKIIKIKRQKNNLMRQSL